MKSNLMISLMIGFLGIVSCPAIASAQPSGGSVTDAGENSVRILSITPNNAETLHVGDQVEVLVEVTYKLSKSPATVSLIIQKGERTAGSPDILLGREKETVTDLFGKVTLKHKITVPETQTILVFTPLFVEGAKTTSMTNSTLDMRMYKVEKKDIAS